MAWRIEVDRAAAKELDGLDAVSRSRILKFLRDRIAPSEDPRSLGKPLAGSRFDSLWRFRVGDYRVIASIEDSRLLVLVVRIGHRKQVYR